MITSSARPIESTSLTVLKPFVDVSGETLRSQKNFESTSFSFNSIESVIMPFDCEMASFRPYSDPCAMSITFNIFFLINGARISFSMKSFLMLADPATTYPCGSSFNMANCLLDYSHAALTKLYLLQSLNLANLTDDCPPLLCPLMISLLISLSTSL